MNQTWKVTLMSLFAFAAGTVVVTNVMAIVAPVAGSFAYDVYDIAILKIIQGPIGFVAGAMAVVFGAVLAIKQEIMGAVPAIIGGAVLLKADTIVTSLGMTF